MHLYKTVLSKEPFQPNPTAKNLRFANIPCFSDEATYVYSLKTKKNLVCTRVDGVIRIRERRNQYAFAG